MAELRKYATGTNSAGTNIGIQMPIAGSPNFATSGDWTPVAGDVKVSIDGGATANIATLPAYTNGWWIFQLSSGETTGKSIRVAIIDSATKAVDDNAFFIETFGNASAMYPDDLSVASATAPTNFSLLSIDGSGRIDIGKILGTASAATAGYMAPDWAHVNAPTTSVALTGTTFSTSQVVASVTGAVGSVTGAVGSVTGAVGSVTGAVGSVTGNVGGNVVGTVASVVGAVGSVTGNVGGNVVGSVGSVTGAVGSVTGAVGSVTGNVGGNVVGTVASVVGAVGSVTGNVGGNVTGSVGSVSGAVGSVTGNVGGNVVGSVATVTAVVSANVTKINSVTVNGVGTVLNPWGP